MFSKIKNEDLRIGEVFNVGFGIYMKYFKYIAAIALLVYIPVSFIELLIPQSSADLFYDLLYNADYEFFLDNVHLFLAPAAVWLVCFIVFFPLLKGGVTGIVRHSIDGKGEAMDALMSGSLKLLGKHTATAITYCLVIGVMSAGFVVFAFMSPTVSLFFIIGLIILMVRYYFCSNSVAYDGSWGPAAIKQSDLVVQGKWFKTFSFVMLNELFTWMISVLILMPFSIIVPSLVESWAGSVVLSLGLGVVSAYFPLVCAVWFINKHSMLEK